MVRHELELTPLENELETPNVFLSLRMSHLINGQPCSLRKLAKLMNGKVHFPHMCELENGTKEPSLTELIAYSDYFNVSIDYLLGRAEAPSGCDNSPVNNSFNELITSLYTSKEPTDKQMFDTLNYLISTHSGRALLFYLSEFVSSDDLEEQVAALASMKAWKGISKKGVMNYQEIMLAISNIMDV